MATTILVKTGYVTLAIPYTDKRVSALADLMENSTQVNTDWHGNMTSAAKPDHERFTFSVVRQEIPVYVKPMPESEPETDEDGTENN